VWRSRARRSSFAATETYHDPGVWSRADFLLDEGITSTATATADHVALLGRTPGAFVSCRVSGWQHASTERLLALPAAMRNLPAPLRLSEDDAVMLSAMWPATAPTSRTRCA